MVKGIKKRGRAATLIAFSLMAALVTGGGTNPDCDNRAVAWGTTSDYNIHMLDQAGSETVDVVPITTSTRRARWYGDDQSRLIMYSWGSEHSGVNYSSLTTSAKAVRATDRSWPLSLSSDEYTNYTEWTVGRPCNGATCGEWKSVTSLDIGFCSLNIPHVRRTSGSSSPLLDESGLSSLSFPLDIIEEIESQLDGGFFDGDGCVAGNCDVYTRLKPNDPVSWWVSTDRRENELCFRIPFEARIDKGLSCPYQWVEASLCGAFEVTPANQITWTSSRSFWARYHNIFSPTCNTARKQVAEGVLERLGRPNSHADGPNEITTAVREQLRSFAMTGDDLELGQGLGRDCVPGAIGDLGCALGVLNQLPSKCVGLQPGQGECRYYAPVSRVEMTPSSVELVLLEQPKGYSSMITELIGEYDGNDPLIQSLRLDHCAALDGSQTDRLSRLHERVFRGNRTLLYPTPHTSSLD